MTPAGASSSSAREAARLRTARPEDAPAISALYRSSYGSRDGRDPRENYPFPQLLEPQWVGEAIRSELIRWIVAEEADTLVGTAGLLTRLGTVEDRVGECFGLVVDAAARERGLGRRILDELVGLASKEVTVAVGQVRTAGPAAARVVERAGFVPLGFEPFTHTIFAGPESMITVGVFAPEAVAGRSLSGATSRIGLRSRVG